MTETDAIQKKKRHSERKLLQQANNNGAAKTTSGAQQSLPASFETFELLYKEAFKHLRTLKEGRVIGVVVAAVVKYFGHVGHKLCDLVVMALL